jgi:succinate dehydrogenase/fumarate reductase cytochrome b subunit
MTGYANMIFFLPVHFMTHRVFPTNPAAPIHALGPAELDFEFVKYGLATWPWRSWFLYGGLVAGVVLHAVEGDRLLFNTYLSESMGRIKMAARKRLLAIGLGLIAIPVLSGIFVMSKEPSMIFSATAERFQAAFTQGPLYIL